MTQSQSHLKKRRERNFFDLAQQFTACWPTGHIDDGGEQPDIVVSTEGGAYGVEVTELVRDDRKAFEDTRRLVCEKARTLWLAEGGLAALDVKVIFQAKAVLNKRAQDAAALELVTIVKAHSPDLGESLASHLQCGVSFESALFQSVWLRYSPSIAYARWQPVGAWWVPLITVADIQAVIDKKQDKLEAYRKRAQDVWLLVVLDGFAGSSAGTLDDAVRVHKFVSQFTGVVLLEHAMGRASTLCT
ncbi:hypothetical protein KEH56_35300 [Burkholderia cenocepacia]|uniref:hypothetical protein n=1 Tax=Burkholderia cenocepacia TaxID=95486 RepID=UPI001BA8C56E|nr:hypothetical protein [Burkholderia cenocepacia]QUN44453.1 hypothetical protein KEH56_35300 [Burkholderia cenocepacia]QUO24083.1 hypothetical protein KEH57_10895 [Burkholderia cenocepacia]